MKFRIETWSIKDIIDSHSDDSLNLNPKYQRRFIWTSKDQQTLIKSILSGFAIPNIFLFENDNKFDVVDGQQRIRTILGFFRGDFSLPNGKKYNVEEHETIFQNYLVPVTIIEEIGANESIEEFYSLVNSSGLRLNRPELKKAEYFDTNFLKLINELTNSSTFSNLDLFTESTTRRMNDVDFVSELLTILIKGITDKKNTVDKIFDKDISESEADKFRGEFNEIMNKFQRFNSVHPIKKTRFKQRNDFYTLFAFIKRNLSLPDEYFDYFYKQLLLYNDHIVPANENCQPFQEYSFHCISQSNSKSARDERNKILESIFTNKKENPSKAQKQILKYFGVEQEKPLILIDKYYLIKNDLIKS